MHQRTDAAAGAVLGVCAGQITRRHEDPDAHGLPVRQSKRYILEQKARRGESP